jgi:N-acetylglucosaminyldiphosphoundecaprenol N-acetyl-beta-D-mannosaminyltransferase
VIATSLERRAACRHAPAARAAPLVNGVRIDPIAVGELGAAVGSFLDCGRSHVVHFVSAHPTVLARRDPAYRAILNKGELNLPDGLPVAWAVHLLGYGGDRVTGTDGFRLLCDWGRAHDVRHFLYGGTDTVLAALGACLEREYPGIAVGGAIAPPFRALSDGELRRDAGAMRDAGADLVWVGLGTPKQDVVAERLRRLDAAPVVLCVGAAFDFLAGAKRRAPRWMQETGLEWAFRLASEPRRLWRRYLLGNPEFVLGLATDLAHARGADRRAAAGC